MSDRKKVTKDMVPDDFTLGLALVDAVPVILFGINTLILGGRLGSGIFTIGAALCLIGGIGKVLWKIIVVLAKKNIWPLFVQMRILMPIGFLAMCLAVFMDRGSVTPADILHGFLHFPAILFYLGGIAGMALMGVFAVKLDNSDLRSNWIEQITNGISQGLILIGILLG